MLKPLRDAQTLVSTRIVAEVGAVTVAGFVENLFDEDYVLEYVSQRFSGSPFGNFSRAGPTLRCIGEVRLLIQAEHRRDVLCAPQGARR
jgi:hypothetical protein